MEPPEDNLLPALRARKAALAQSLANSVSEAERNKLQSKLNELSGIIADVEASGTIPTALTGQRSTSSPRHPSRGGSDAWPPARRRQVIIRQIQAKIWQIEALAAKLEEQLPSEAEHSKLIRQFTHCLHPLLKQMKNGD